MNDSEIVLQYIFDYMPRKDKDSLLFSALLMFCSTFLNQR